VGKSRIGSTLHRCERSVFLLHPHHFPVAGTLEHAQTLLHQQYDPPPNTAKSSLNLTPKRDIHADPVHSLLRFSQIVSEFSIVRLSCHYASGPRFFEADFCKSSQRNLTNPVRTLTLDVKNLARSRTALELRPCRNGFAIPIDKDRGNAKWIRPANPSVLSGSARSPQLGLREPSPPHGNIRPYRL
jgi:hypothetical protein